MTTPHHNHNFPPTTESVASTPQWQDLVEYSHQFTTTLRELFAEQPGRAGDLSFDAGPLHVDLSKNLVDDRVIRLLTDVARAMGLEEYRAAMLDGVHINTTEDRAVLHTALRLPVEQNLVIPVQGAAGAPGAAGTNPAQDAANTQDADNTQDAADTQDVAADVHEVLGRMRDFAKALRSGNWQGITGNTIKHVVNIGIGGSDLGPAMAASALRAYRTAGITPHFVANIDPADLTKVLDGLDPKSTLFIVSSKTFTTAETLANAHAARRWLLTELRERGVDTGSGEAEDPTTRSIIEKHFVAVSTNTAAVRDFGIDPANMFHFWDWVGGRYSVSSAIGLSLMAAIGPQDFMRFLDGFHQIDDHFRSEPLEMNVPVLMGLLGIWYTDVLGAQSHAVMPYSEDLREFPDYLQQLMMESNGKSVRLTGAAVDIPTGEIYWGAPGSNGQHAFFQLLHQGTHLVPADFIGFVNPHDDHHAADGETSMHDLLMANLFAQTRVLAFGRSAEELAAEGVEETLIPHKVMPGNRPSTTILAPALTPETLGALIALYEHIAFVQGVIWGINSFDQWGVELGKKQATELLPAVTGKQRPDAGDSSTDGLISYYRQHRASR